MRTGLLTAAAFLLSVAVGSAQPDPNNLQPQQPTQQPGGQQPGQGNQPGPPYPRMKDPNQMGRGMGGSRNPGGMPYNPNDMAQRMRAGRGGAGPGGMPPGMGPVMPYDPNEMSKHMRGGPPNGGARGMPPGMQPGGPYDPQDMARRMTGRGGMGGPPPSAKPGGTDEDGADNSPSPPADTRRTPEVRAADARAGKPARADGKAKRDDGDGNTWKWYVGGALVFCGFVVTLMGACFRS
jgi:hypothetical protein